MYLECDLMRNERKCTFGEDEVDRREGSVQELGKKSKITLAGNRWVGVDSCRGCGNMGPGLEEAGGEKGRKGIITWMEVAEE